MPCASQSKAIFFIFLTDSDSQRQSPRRKKDKKDKKDKKTLTEKFLLFSFCAFWYDSWDGHPKVGIVTMRNSRKELWRGRYVLTFQCYYAC